MRKRLKIHDDFRKVIEARESPSAQLFPKAVCVSGRGRQEDRRLIECAHDSLLRVKSCSTKMPIEASVPQKPDFGASIGFVFGLSFVAMLRRQLQRNVLAAHRFAALVPFGTIARCSDVCVAECRASFVPRGRLQARQLLDLRFP